MRHSEIKDTVDIKIGCLKDYTNNLKLLTSEEFQKYTVTLNQDKSRNETVNPEASGIFYQ